MKQILTQKYFTMIFLLNKWMTNRPSEKGKLPIESKGSEGQWQKVHEKAFLGPFTTK